MASSGIAICNSICLKSFTLYLCFIFIVGQKLVHMIGHNSIDVVSRLMGLILAVIGTQMLLQGIHDAKSLF